ncbi:SDR family oxidoreductase [Pusillimonas sp. TS35]|uniref:NAD-dependent epimerase/dehydratase family protein n=1 Tax=Paracandidimonas lactea TaxID=2895524 RepID=UPI00136CC70A|nr:NAD(P)-dependent oxidoreductase [Paracandidimonas lactea]MYN13887.1 SDR family oxidoreductase [Pusillimonas sp. TS35]
MSQERCSTVFITGAQGMIGRACADALHGRGCRVVATDINPTSEPLPYAFERVDVRDRNALSSLMDHYRPDGVIHAGGYSGPMQSVDDPLALVDVNVGGLANLVDCARRMNVTRFVWFSSILAYGDQSDCAMVPPSQRLRPNTLYGATKAAGECLLDTYAALYGISAIALRPTGVYGPGRTTRCLVRTLLTHGLAGTALTLNPAPVFTRQFVHVDDVVTAAVAALGLPLRPGLRSYNVADGHGWTTQEVVAYAQRLLPSLRVEYDDRVEPIGGFRMGVLDVRSTRKDLDWAPRIGLDAGMASYLEYLRQKECTA